MTDTDTHVHKTWNLTRDTDGDEITIDLWTDGYSVRVDGGDGEACEGGPKSVEDLLEKYGTAGYRVRSAYQVNDLHTPAADEADDEPEGFDQRPDKCPECGTEDLDYVAHHTADWREGPAFLCTGCKWGQWIAV